MFPGLSFDSTDLCLITNYFGETSLYVRPKTTFVSVYELVGQFDKSSNVNQLD